MEAFIWTWDQFSFQNSGHCFPQKNPLKIFPWVAKQGFPLSLQNFRHCRVSFQKNPILLLKGQTQLLLWRLFNLIRKCWLWFNKSKRLSHKRMRSDRFCVEISQMMKKGIKKDYLKNFSEENSQQNSKKKFQFFFLIFFSGKGLDLTNLLDKVPKKIRQIR